MPITPCPSCQADLEVPAVVPGGLVACPYCGTEFAPKGRPAARRARRTTRRRDDVDDYEEERGRGRYRRRVDPMPIIMIVGAAIILGGAATYFLTKGARDRAALRREKLAAFAKTPPVHIDFQPVPDAPRGEPFEMPDVFLVGDRVTLRRLDLTANLSHYVKSVDDPKEREVETLYGLTYTVTMLQREGEKVTEVEGDRHVHEGRYDLLSYLSMGNPVIQAQMQFGARFETDGKGRPVPGTFEQTEGPRLTPPPVFVADRSFGILPDHAVRHGAPGETWGTQTLEEPFTRHITIDHRPFAQVPFQRSRIGGWRIWGGDAIKEHDGSWARNATYSLKLKAVENGRWANATFAGQPADMSYWIEWKGSATYMIKKQVLSTVNDLTVSIAVRVRTATEINEWRGMQVRNFEMFKDP